MTVEIKDIQKVAKLCRIEMSDADLEKYREDLSAILDLANELSEVNTDSVEPMTSVEGDKALRQREDIVNDGNCQQKVLSNAPDAEEGFFTVPKVVG